METISIRKPLINRVTEAKGFESNSASPSDIWSIKTEDGKEIIFKIALSNQTPQITLSNGISINSDVRTEGVFYEGNILKYITNTIVNENINPYFVKLDELYTNVNFNFLLSFYSKFQVDYETFKSRILRNTIYMNITQKEKHDLGLEMARPPINESLPTQSGKQNIEYLINELDTYKDNLYYNILATEKSTTLKLITLLNNYSLVDGNGNLNTDGWLIIIQTLTALSTLEKIECAHNDLHYNNILIEEINTDTKYFKGDDVEFTLTSNFNCKIYDWDRGYIKDFGKNKILTDGRCSNRSFCNEYVPQRELFRFFNNFIHLGRDTNFIGDPQKEILWRFIMPRNNHMEFINNCKPGWFLNCENFAQSISQKDYLHYGFNTPTQSLNTVLKYLDQLNLIPDNLKIINEDNRRNILGKIKRKDAYDITSENVYDKVNIAIFKKIINESNTLFTTNE